MDGRSQLHSATNRVPGKKGAVFHSQGGKSDTAEAELARFCRKVNEATTKWLGGSHIPLILAGVKSTTSAYRRMNTYRFSPPLSVDRNCDDISDKELHEMAWSTYQPLIESQRASLAARYSNSLSLGPIASSDDPIDVVSAANEGRVECLFYDPHAELYGVCEGSSTIRLTGNSNDDDLIGIAAIATLRHRGAIHSMEYHSIPTNSPIAAILRY